MARVTDYKVALLLSIDLMRIVCMWCSVTVASDTFLFRRADIRIVLCLTPVEQRKMPCQIAISCCMSLGFLLLHSIGATSCWKVWNQNLFVHLTVVAWLFVSCGLKCLFSITTVLHISLIKYRYDLPRLERICSFCCLSCFMLDVTKHCRVQSQNSHCDSPWYKNVIYFMSQTKVVIKIVHLRLLSWREEFNHINQCSEIIEWNWVFGSDLI